MYERNIAHYTHLHHSVLHMPYHIKMKDNKPQKQVDVACRHTTCYRLHDGFAMCVGKVCVCVMNECVLVLYLHNVFYIIRLLSKHTSQQYEPLFAGNDTY